MVLPVRKRNRLKNYDYSGHGAYFVTICTEGKENILCRIVGDGFAIPLEPGRIVQQCILQIPERFPCVSVEIFVVMPNHVHMLVLINRENGMGAPSPTLGNIIGWFKYRATKEINRSLGTEGERIFQRSYHDHVIRGEKDYIKIWEYIDANPRLWAEDCFYTE